MRTRLVKLLVRLLLLLRFLLLLLLLLLLLELLVLGGLLHETALLVQLLDSLIEALVSELLVEGLTVLMLLANLPLQSLHIGLIAEQDHLKEVRLGPLDFVHVEAHLVELLLEHEDSLVLDSTFALVVILEEHLLVFFPHQIS